ncbi:hypothetical protein V3C99_014945 [Haemonchus contortus]
MKSIPAIFFSFFPTVLAETQLGSGVFTMTFESADIVYLSLCYTEWPSPSGSFLQSPCLFHPYPYNFTITPGHPTKIGRPLRHMHSDYITVSINATTGDEGYRESIVERFLVDGSLPARKVTTMAEIMSVKFEVTCNQNYFGLRCGRFCKTSANDYSHFTCSGTDRIDLHDGGNLVLSRLVSANHKPAIFAIMKQRSDKHAFIFIGAMLFTTFIGFALYLINAQRVEQTHPVYFLDTF